MQVSYSHIPVCDDGLTRVFSGRLTGMALRMQTVLREGIAALSGLSMNMRIALHVGTCMGGIGMQYSTHTLVTGRICVYTHRSLSSPFSTKCTHVRIKRRRWCCSPPPAPPAPPAPSASVPPSPAFPTTCIFFFSSLLSLFGHNLRVWNKWGGRTRASTCLAVTST